MEVPETAQGTQGLCPGCARVVCVPGVVEIKEKEPHPDNKKEKTLEKSGETKTYREKQREKARSTIIKMKSGKEEGEKYKETIEQKELRENKFKKIERRLRMEEKQSENRIVSFKAGLFVLIICLGMSGVIYYKTRPDTAGLLLQQAMQIQKNADRNFQAKDYQAAQAQYKKILNLISEEKALNQELIELENYAEKQLISCRKKLLSGKGDKEKTKSKPNSRLKPPGF
jgi:hypothetical protein